MKKFNYRGESYLKFLVFKRQEALKVLKKSEAVRNQLIEKFRELTEKKRQAFCYNESIGWQKRSLHLVNDNNLFIQKLSVSLTDLTERIQNAEAKYQENHNALVEVQLQLRKIELHKESELQKYKKEYKRRSQKVTDEINATRRRGQNAKSL
jgi:flagellar biosynthesis chaperone FliJ